MSKLHELLEDLRAQAMGESAPMLRGITPADIKKMEVAGKTKQQVWDELMLEVGVQGHSLSAMGQDIIPMLAYLQKSVYMGADFGSKKLAATAKLPPVMEKVKQSLGALLNQIEVAVKATSAAPYRRQMRGR